MYCNPRSLVALSLFALSFSPVVAQPSGILSDLAAGEYRVRVEGKVNASADSLVATEADSDVTEKAIRADEASERLLFRDDSFHSPKSTDSGPFEVEILLSGEHVGTGEEGAELVIVGIHFSDSVTPGAYPIDEGFLDVGPNAAPVSVMLAGVAKDQSQQHVFSWDVSGEAEIQKLGRDGATGVFQFSAHSMNEQGQVTEETVTANVAFKDVPYTVAE